MVEKGLGEASCEGWASVENWKSRVSYNFGYHGENRLRNFLAYIQENEPRLRGLTPDDLVAFQQTAANSERYVILDALQRWINSKVNLRAQSKSGYYTSVRSFFMHSRAELPKDPSFKVRSETPPVRSQLDVETVRNVILASKPRYQAIFVIMVQSGMDQASFMHWNHTGLESTLKQLRERPEGPLRIEIPGRKGSKNLENFYTFVGSDGCRLLGSYLKSRGNKPGPMFRVSKKAMIKYWTRQLKRLGYIEQEGSDKGNRYGLNLHRLRSIFRSRWRLSGVDVDVCEFFLGHAPDKLGYDKSPWLDPHWYEDKYVEAVSWLNILSEDPLHVPMREVTELRKKLNELEAGQGEKAQRLEVRLEEAQRALVDREARLLHVEQTMDIVMRALANPETAPSLWKALKEMEEKAERPR